jgi:hypothetical protein
MLLQQRLLILLTFSLLLSFFSWGKTVLYPIQIFTTWVHECCHALTATLLGGDSIKITLATDGSGLTHYQIPKSKLRHATIASAGYLGASLIGCLLFYLAIQTERPTVFWNVHHLALFLSGLMILSLVFWIRNFFGAFSVLLLAGALASLNYSPMNQYAHEVLLFLAIQTSLNSLFDIRTLFSLGSSSAKMSDAHTLQKLFWLPHWVWAMLWLSVSITMIYVTIQKSGIWKF